MAQRATKPKPVPLSRSELRKIRLTELRTKAAEESRQAVEALFPTASPIYAPTVPGYSLTTARHAPDEPTVSPVAEGDLARLAHEINTRFTLAAQMDGKANDHRLAAAIQLAEARRLCGEQRLNFKRWAQGHIPQSYVTVRELSRVGGTPDPKQALADLRGDNAVRNRELRARQAAEKAQAQQQHRLTGPAPSAPRPAPAPPAAIEAPPIARPHVQDMMLAFSAMDPEEQASFLQLAAERIGASLELPEHA